MNIHDKIVVRVSNIGFVRFPIGYPIWFVRGHGFVTGDEYRKQFRWFLVPK
jgi:hypothetical protein